MPKIRQAIALLVAVGGCIAFNTFRYPVVREMAAAVSAMGPSTGTKAGETQAPSPSDARHASSTEKPAKGRTANVVCKDGVCTFVSPESPAASIHSSYPSRESSADTLKAASAKAASSANPENAAESASRPWDSPESEPRTDDANSSKSWPTAGFDSKSSWGSNSKSADDESRHSPREAATDATAEGRSEAAAGTGTIAKFVSALVGEKSPPKDPGDSSLGESSLVPIQRPKSRPKKAKASTAVASSMQMMSSGRPSSVDTTVRRLPPVDPVSAADFLASPPTLSPEQIREYAVTTVK